jgi:hypothetical protein
MAYTGLAYGGNAGVSPPGETRTRQPYEDHWANIRARSDYYESPEGQREMYERSLQQQEQQRRMYDSQTARQSQERKYGVLSGLVSGMGGGFGGGMQPFGISVGKTGQFTRS